MGFLDLFKPKKSKEQEKTLHTAVGQKTLYPSFRQFGEEITGDITILAMLNRTLDEYSKLNPRHIRTVNERLVPTSTNNINRVLRNPNPLMTKSDFLRRIAYLRETTCNAFIYPIYDVFENTQTKSRKTVLAELYPLQPTTVNFWEDDEGTLFVEFQFANGKWSPKLAYEDIIHWRKDYGANEFLGGDEKGKPNNDALLKLLKLNDKLLQSTFKIVEGSLVINGVLKFGGVINKKDREEARKNFEKDLKSNETGIIALDNLGDYIPIPFNGKSLDSNMLEFYRKNIRQSRGVSEPILNGDYTNEQKEAFYETVIEQGAISLGEAFSKVLLSEDDRNNGNEIVFYTNRVQMMSSQRKIQLAQLLLPAGGVSTNRVLSWFGEPPVEGGDDLYMSLNWIKKDIADEYQLEKYKYGNNASNNKNNIKDENNNKGVE